METDCQPWCRGDKKLNGQLKVQNRKCWYCEESNRLVHECLVSKMKKAGTMQPTMVKWRPVLSQVVVTTVENGDIWSANVKCCKEN